MIERVELLVIIVEKAVAFDHRCIITIVTEKLAMNEFADRLAYIDDIPCVKLKISVIDSM